MCTAITYKTNGFYFGRNLDLERSFGETVTITPRNFPFTFRNGATLETHYALVGMATVRQGYPLYFEATNEMGLSIAGLNFPDNAFYYKKSETKENITPFELIPRLLGSCATVVEVKNAIENINLWNVSFSKELPLSPLHWLVADENGAFVIEPMAEGLRIFDNSIGVLTNNPPFDFHMLNLSNYMNVSPLPPENRFSKTANLKPYSLGMGAMGLPGDPSSASRFIRAAFTKLNSISGDSDFESISQFFHILNSVAQQKGVTYVAENDYEYTQYSSCCNTAKGIYYYTTYENSRITAVDMNKEDLQGSEIITYPLVRSNQILMQN